MQWPSTWLLAIALAVSSCRASPAPTTEPQATAFPVVASSDLAVGEERLLVALYDDQTRSLASSDLPVRLHVFPPGEGAPIEVEGQFLWTIPDERGLYRATVRLAEAGQWAVAVQADRSPITDPTPFTVKAEPSTVAVGEVAPRSETPTTDEAELGEMTTDPDPDPRLYELSVAEAVTSGRPSAIVFSTPRFCTSRTCGPTLDQAQEEAHRYPDVNFVHVEIYDLTAAPEQLLPVPAVEEWGLPSEPWVFVVDEQGRVSARFEGTVSAEELEAALGASA